jgi:phosphoribosylglycinamide formyltransferase-1
LSSARELGVATAAWKGERQEGSFERMLLATLETVQPDVIALAGFMRILSPAVVERYLGCMLNIHPSLLPAYRGLHTHRRALAAGDTEHGASVHFLTPELDAGPVILQSKVPVLPGDSEVTLAARVLATEHIIYPRVIGWLGAGRLAWRAGAPWLDGRRLEAPIVEDFSASVV